MGLAQARYLGAMMLVKQKVSLWQVSPTRVGVSMVVGRVGQGMVQEGPPKEVVGMPRELVVIRRYSGDI